MFNTERQLQLKRQRANLAKAGAQAQITEHTTDYQLTTEWQRIEGPDLSRIGIEIENQDAAAIHLFTTGSVPIRDTQARAVNPGIIRMIDTLAAQDALYAKTDTAGTWLTLTIKRRVVS